MIWMKSSFFNFHRGCCRLFDFLAVREAGIDAIGAGCQAAYARACRGKVGFEVHGRSHTCHPLRPFGKFLTDIYVR